MGVSRRGWQPGGERWARMGAGSLQVPVVEVL